MYKLQMIRHLSFTLFFFPLINKQTKKTDVGKKVQQANENVKMSTKAVELLSL